MSLSRTRLPAGWTPAEDELAGRVIVITGACGGLGRAAALACAAAGAQLVLAGRKVRALEKLYDAVAAVGGPEPVLLPIDLAGASPRDYDEPMDAIEREFGRVDGVLHAAAHFAGLTPMRMEKPEDWLRDLQVNLTAPFLLTQALHPLLEKSSDPATVFVIDDPERTARAHWGGYGVAKAGLERMASILDAESASTNLRVHVLLPAPMRTALRRTAWFGENTLDLPPPDAVAAPAVVYLLGAAGAAARGCTLDLRAAESSPGA